MSNSILFADLLAPNPLPTPQPIAPLIEKTVAALTQNTGSPNTPSPARYKPRINPWNRVGVPLGTDADAITAAKLDWEVKRVDLRTADTLDPVPDFAAIRRSDTNRILGVVGADYEPFQNRAMFDLIADLGKANEGLPFTIETAGAFQHGRTVWALAHLPALSICIGDDEAKTYLLISNGHVGNKTLIIAPTTVRVVCQNTLRMAEAQIRSNRDRPGLAGGFTIRHTAAIHDAVVDAKEAFTETIRAHAKTKAIWKRLADVPLTEARETALFNRVFGAVGPDESERARAMRKTRDERLKEILASPTSQVRGTKDSLFSAMQAVIEYVDHERTTRTTDGSNADEARLFSATFGSGAAVKERAWDVALEMAA